MTKTVTVHAQQKWEYATLIRRTDTALLAELNVSGQEGWELITVLNYKDMKGTTSWIGFLKRPSTGQPPTPVAQAGPAVHKPAQGDETQADARGFDVSDGDFEFKDQ